MPTYNKHRNRFWIAPITGYQYISQVLPGSCRYYPTCSEYAKWSFETTSPHRAMLSTTLRILSCNQLFPGGIDYPVISYKIPSLLMMTPYLNFLCGKMKVKYWIVPKIDSKKADRYYVIKDHNAH
ncbi:MAG: membrane protein insertion efficiency factor YidD [Campylobacterota bacterium]|nr:membrane protein insertion efficiency factor YidD [Campylobacterota bacterium]